jgi:hypothetical protein
MVLPRTLLFPVLGVIATILAGVLLLVASTVDVTKVEHSSLITASAVAWILSGVCVGIGIYVSTAPK